MIETIWLKTKYALFFIELGIQRIYLVGCTTTLDLTWITQLARQLVGNLKDDSREITFLIQNNDTRFTSSYDNVFSSEGIKILHAPYRTPRANDFTNCGYD